MCELSTHQQVEAYQAYDPTHTTVLRNAFARDMKKRFDELIRVINQSVQQNNVFNLTSYQMTPATSGAFSFPRSTDKVSAFMEWLDRQVKAGILEIGTSNQLGTAIDNAWTNKYILDSYKRGIIRARWEMRKAKMNVPAAEAIGGVSLLLASSPVHLDRLGLLYTRVYSNLKGITAEMDSIISRILTQGIADGDGSRLLGRKLVSAINGTGTGDLGITDSLGRFIPAKRRADMLARTEVIRAHHQANIQEYMNWRVENVIVKAEWRTAGDNRVCSKCSKLQGEVFTLEEVMNMIPQHPLCRCIALPYKV